MRVIIAVLAFSAVIATNRGPEPTTSAGLMDCYELALKGGVSACA